MNNEISRRDAIKSAFAIGCAAVGVAGCGQNDEPQAATPGTTQNVSATVGSGGSFTVPVGGLEADGMVLASLPDKRNVLIFKTKDGKVGAVTAKCTHQGCSVTFNKSTEVLNCPCHGSQFDTAGKVIKGPATAPLEKFTVEIKGSNAVLKS